jgi:enoyl-CoA hydratase/carnithine racemase
VTAEPIEPIDQPSLELPDFGSPFLKAHLDGRVLHLRVDRTERRNSFTQDLYRAIKRAAVWSDQQAELDAVCLTGTDKWFGAGGDMAGNAVNVEELNLEWDSTDHFPFRHIERSSKLWVAKINGLCHAGGLDLVLHCDISVAADTARFRVPELLRGIPDPMMSARLAQAVGVAKAKFLFFTAAEIDAATADRIGLIGEVVPAAELDARVKWVLQQIALTGPASRAAVKRDINQRQPQADMGLFLRSMRTAEMMEGMRSFVEKRPPVWPR